MPAIGVLLLELRLDSAHSLKEKRQILQSLKTRLHHKFNVAVAEIDHQDTWQRSVIAAVTVASAREPAAHVLDQVEREAAYLLAEQLANVTVEWLE
jgi:uncharacterized protein YlxP (DUF503 family)